MLLQDNLQPYSPYPVTVRCRTCLLLGSVLTLGAEKLSQTNQSKLGLGVGERSKHFGTRKNSSGDEDGAQILCFQLPQLAMLFLALSFILCLACCWLRQVPH